MWRGAVGPFVMPTTYTLSNRKKIQNVTEMVEGTGSMVRAISFQHQ
jgi:hypothetical protein